MLAIAHILPPWGYLFCQGPERSVMNDLFPCEGGCYPAQNARVSLDLFMESFFSHESQRFPVDYPRAKDKLRMVVPFEVYFLLLVYLKENIQILPNYSFFF